jgi:site-specific DNA-methyltransferase (adenine-specific)
MNSDEIKNSIFHGDCFDVLDTFPENSIDLIVTSPPYAMKRKDTYGGIPEDKFAQWLFDFSEKAMRVIKDSGSLVVNIKEGCKDNARQIYVLEYQLMMAKAFIYVDTFVWHKTNPYPTGSLKRLKDGFEYCFHFTKTKKYKFFPSNCLVPSNEKWTRGNKSRKNQGEHDVNNGSGMSMSKRFTSDWARPSNVLMFSTNTTNTNHPATFPIDLPMFFIKLMTEEGDLVCDPFMGSGTTAVAAKSLYRNYTGCDLDKEYIKASQSRLRKEMIIN